MGIPISNIYGNIHRIGHKCLKRWTRTYLEMWPQQRGGHACDLPLFTTSGVTSPVHLFRCARKRSIRRESSGKNPLTTDIVLSKKNQYVVGKNNIAKYILTGPS